MRIGLDLDNTLVDYDQAFTQAALEAGLIGPEIEASKRAVREHIWASHAGDEAWRGLQAEVYGPGIHKARLARGALDFVRLARRKGGRIFIISHKTKQASAAPLGVDLRQAALDWLTRTELVGDATVPREQILFADTREEKIALMRKTEVEVFVDDLVEVLKHPDFPSHVRRLHYAPEGGDAAPEVETCRDWDEVAARLFGREDRSDERC